VVVDETAVTGRARTAAGRQMAIARALSHPTRVRILMAMNSPRRRMSPKLFCDETGVQVGHASYHFRELAASGCIEMVETKQRRGATEHFYEPVKTALAWTREWEALGPVVKQNLCASVLRGAVEAVGTAIDDGTFEARADSHLSWDTMKIDEEGWRRMTEIFDRSLAELLELQAECAERIAGGGAFFLVSFFMSTFESPPPAAKKLAS
jgi:Helix-turn-helix domain